MLTPGERETMLAEGGAALQAGRIAEAIVSGERVLAAFPDDVQALYLVGVASSRRGEFEAAVRLLDRVLERAPDAAPVVAERQRAAEALGRRIVEHEVCHEALPLLAPLIAERAEVRPGVAAHVVLATAEVDASALALARRAAATIGIIDATYWRETFPPIRAGIARPVEGPLLDAPPGIEPHGHAFPRTGLVMLVGVARSPLAWWSRCAPAEAVLVIDAANPCEVLARVREVSGKGARKIALLYADADLARAMRLPGRVLGDAA
jgi:tetratricopeptide (TPR) repeat protein